MNNDIEKTIRDFEAYTEWLLKDKERCDKFLQRAGIIDKNGNLTTQYQPEIKVKNKEDM